MEKSKEEVIEYIENSSTNNPRFDELKNKYATIIWKIKIKMQVYG